MNEEELGKGLVDLVVEVNKWLDYYCKHNPKADVQAAIKAFNKLEVTFSDFVRLLTKFVKRPKVSKASIELLRDRMMAIPIKEYYTPGKRQFIAKEIADVFTKHGYEVEE